MSWEDFFFALCWKSDTLFPDESEEIVSSKSGSTKNKKGSFFIMGFI